MANAQSHDTLDINEIQELLNIPEIEAYFSDVLQNVKQIFKEQIDQYGNSRKSVKIFKKSTAEVAKVWPKGKTYFFDLNGVRDENGIRWEPVKAKPPRERDFADQVLVEFTKKIDKYKVSPELIQKTIIELPAMKKSFKIKFTKKSDTRVCGYVKEMEKPKDVKDFVIIDDSSILMVTNEYKKLKKESMYGEIKQLMKQHPELIEDIYFYSCMILNPGKESRNKFSKY